MVLTAVVVLGVVPQARAQSGGEAARAAAIDAETRVRLQSVIVASPDTPTGQGLLPIALSEAHAALAAVRRATEAGADLPTLQREARGVLHALDPSIVSAGPGSGFGLRRAVSAITTEVQQLASADRKRDAASAASRALSACANVRQWTDALVAAAEAVTTAPSADAAVARLATMKTLAWQLTGGVDRDGDGRVTFAAGEGGLHILQLSLGTLALSRDGVVPPTLRGTR